MVKQLVWSDDNFGAVRVDNWPAGAPRLFTVVLQTNNFIGSITIQGSIAVEPSDDDWFDLNTETYLAPERTENKYKNKFFNCKGRIIWMRAVIQKSVERHPGRVERILVN